MSINRIRRDADPAALGPAIRAHVEWVKGLIAQGVVPQAGRWGNAGGMMIVKAEDEVEAQAIQTRDPLVAAGMATYELAPFYPDVPLD